MAQTPWRCSQCGTVNEAGSRACRQCGKWPSLFDLQDGAVEEGRPEAPSTFERPDFDPETFDPGPLDPAPFDPAPFDPEDVGQEGAEPVERRGRVPRWVVTAIWVVGVLVWIVVNALGDRG